MDVRFEHVFLFYLIITTQFSVILNDMCLSPMQREGSSGAIKIKGGDQNT